MYFDSYLDMSLYIPKNYRNLLGSVENTEKAIKAVKDMFQRSRETGKIPDKRDERPKGRGGSLACKMEKA